MAGTQFDSIKNNCLKCYCIATEAKKSHNHPD